MCHPRIDSFQSGERRTSFLWICRKVCKPCGMSALPPPAGGSQTQAHQRFTAGLCFQALPAIQFGTPRAISVFPRTVPRSRPSLVYGGIALVHARAGWVQPELVLTVWVYRHQFSLVRYEKGSIRIHGLQQSQKYYRSVRNLMTQGDLLARILAPFQFGLLHKKGLVLVPPGHLDAVPADGGIAQGRNHARPPRMPMQPDGQVRPRYI
jgi:hypothetical protein